MDEISFQSCGDYIINKDVRTSIATISAFPPAFGVPDLSLQYILLYTLNLFVYFIRGIRVRIRYIRGLCIH